jgi:divalent metal cation (Fe/Co/Zn/Cd) transporter
MKKQNKAATMTDEQRARAAQRCTWIGFGCNGVLSFLKIVAGIVGHSGAMIADGVHSISDFLTDIIVIVFVGVSARGVNKVYRYGHGKFETFRHLPHSPGSGRGGRDALLDQRHQGVGCACRGPSA